MVRRGKLLPEGAERTPTLRIFRGSRGGMWWKRHRAGREAHGGAGVEPATEAYKGNRSRRGLSWESEGFIVPIEGAKDNTTPPEGRDPTLFALLKGGGRGDCAMALTTPEKIRTLQRKLYRQAKPEPASWLDPGACLRKKNIGKPCMGKPYARKVLST